MSGDDFENQMDEYYKPTHKVVMVPVKVSVHEPTDCIYTWETSSREDIEKALKNPNPADQDIRELLIRAYKYDDKPHHLYSFIMTLAEKYYGDSKQIAEIKRLMDQQYNRKR